MYGSVYAQMRFNGRHLREHKYLGRSCKRRLLKVHAFAHLWIEFMEEHTMGRFRPVHFPCKGGHARKKGQQAIEPCSFSFKFSLFFFVSTSKIFFLLRLFLLQDSTLAVQPSANQPAAVLKHQQNLTPKRSTLDPQSSICGNNPKAKSRENEVRGATSASSPDHQSDNEETDVAQSEQSLDPSHLKRLRRMLSNRESARRSRKRKQEHLTDLEFLAEQLRGENHSLYRQLTNAHQQFRDADTSNRVLKSDVEALRAKVKLAEDVLARGSLPCGLNQLVQTQLTSPQTIASHNHSLGRVANVSPTITIHGDVSSNSGLTISGDISNVNANLNNGTGADAAVSCVSEIWR
ncbi:basic leucine zipper 9 [Gossypium hirsutum]|uniref:Basic leucine zipper 9 n=1 Tax=Gossypium hirsutum TaxID=3635 RepID=A0ABM3AFP1_GOSHI|nr:basic leucine zipper 9-like [Gossypium hirsutum]